MEFLKWFFTAVNRNLELVVNVLEAPKEKATTAQQLDGLIVNLKVIGELGMDIDDGKVTKLVSALRNAEIVEKLGYQNTPAFIETASTLL
jgi:hypothetical protein